MSTLAVAKDLEGQVPLAEIAIIDLGGQYSHMIGRRLRDVGIRSEIFTPEVPSGDLRKYAGVILSGGPQSVYDEHAPTVDQGILHIGRPVLGICYGHQLLAKMLGSDVTPSSSEYGKSTLQVSQRARLFEGTPDRQTVWMSHGDSVKRLGVGLRKLARTQTCDVAAFADQNNQFFGVQFHPEVAHTECGKRLLRNFSRRICAIQGDETTKDRVERLTAEIRQKVGNRSVFFFVSGGVDSTVAFALCARALPHDKVLGVYVDTGLMRKNETEELASLFQTLGLDDRLKIRPESDRFLRELGDEVDPEEKRKIIGRVFVQVQNAAMREYGIDSEHWMLGQGTIYPDTVESGGATQATALIKTHHNRCAEIRELIEKGRVLEPLAQFYKDEVREIGQELGLDRRLTSRWPFPGPGLAIRCLGWSGNIEKSQPIDPHIDRRSMTIARGIYHGVEFPIKSVGVQGDGRTYRRVAALAGPLDYRRLSELSASLCNNSDRYNRVVVLIGGDAQKLSKAEVHPEHTTVPRLDLLREADYIMRTTMEEHRLTDAVWQFPVVLIPVSLGGGNGETIVLRPVNSEDGMTANYAQLPPDVVLEIGAKIKQLPGIDAVFLDVTDKPPATIEWE